MLRKKHRNPGTFRAYSSITNLSSHKTQESSQVIQASINASFAEGTKKHYSAEKTDLCDDISLLQFTSMVEIQLITTPSLLVSAVKGIKGCIYIDEIGSEGVFKI
ncbi:hypothetical protein LIER_10604 [Lithospermum erythrorhizon]|uniref:Uncharacterized protein n=1 Tax=Lithospermum erythrorhizon TaxID=34254 RepID=A0AAV3PJV1_LITER